VLEYKYIEDAAELGRTSPGNASRAFGIAIGVGRTPGPGMSKIRRGRPCPSAQNQDSTRAKGAAAKSSR
jgi:hypothetical protein